MEMKLLERHKQNILSTLIFAMARVDIREMALAQLSAMCHSLVDLGSVLWNAPGVVSVLLYELTFAFYNIEPPTLTNNHITRLCNTMNIIQCIVSDPSTSLRFVEAHMPQYIFPFLYCKDNGYVNPLKCAVLIVIATLLSHKERAIANYLLTTDIIPICLCFMEFNCESIKIAATYVLHNMLMHGMGLDFICETYDQFSYVALILERTVLTVQIEPSVRLLKEVLGCYLRLSESTKACQALQQCIPTELLELSNLPEYDNPNIFNDLLQLKNNLFPNQNEND